MMFRLFETNFNITYQQFRTILCSQTIIQIQGLPKYFTKYVDYSRRDVGFQEPEATLVFNINRKK